MKKIVLAAAMLIMSSQSISAQTSSTYIKCENLYNIGVGNYISFYIDASNNSVSMVMDNGNNVVMNVVRKAPDNISWALNNPKGVRLATFKLNRYTMLLRSTSLGSEDGLHKCRKLKRQL